MMDSWKKQLGFFFWKDKHDLANPYTNQHKEKNQISNIRDQTVITKI